MVSNESRKEMIEPKDIAGAAYWGPKILKEVLAPSKQYVETQPVLTHEEAYLFDQLREGGPCVICGSRGANTVKVCLCKFVKRANSGALFWKKDTHYYIRKSVAAPLCAKHYHEAKVSETMGCVVPLVVVLEAWLFSMLMLLFKKLGYCVIFDNDDGTVALWFFVGLVVFYIPFRALGVLSKDRLKFDSVWKYGPLQRLLELWWVKCDKEVGAEQLDEAEQKGGA